MTIEAKIEQTNELLKQILGALGTARIAGAAQGPVELKAKPAKQEAKQPAPVETPPATPAALDYDKDVFQPMMALAKAKGRETVVELLGGFQVKTAKDLKPAQWPAFIEAVKKAAA